MVSNLDRFKVMLEEHDGTGITQREYALRDFLALFNTLPGYIGQAALETTSQPEEEKTCVGTLPKGSKVRAFAIKVDDWPQGGTAIQLGTKDEPAHFGEIPIPGPDEQDGAPDVLEDWHNDNEALPDDTEVFLTVVGFDKQQEENMAGGEEEEKSPLKGVPA
jgi:hypothetical protein